MATDRFKIALVCPKCGKKATASAEEEDGWAYLKGKTDTHISDLPDGFKIVKEGRGMESVEIYCSDCNVQANK